MDSAVVLLADVKAKLEEYIKNVTEFAIIHITENCYAVRTPPTNMSCLDYVHVNRKGNPPSFVCAFGSRCDRVTITVAKKTKTFTRCSHEHFANILGGNATEQQETAPPQSTVEQVSDDHIKTDDNLWLKNSSQYRFDHQKVKLELNTMKKIESEILRLYKSDDGFPTVYQVKEGITML